jgi:hypothetical protein
MSGIALQHRTEVPTLSGGCMCEQILHGRICGEEVARYCSSVYHYCLDKCVIYIMPSLARSTRVL